MTDEVTQDVDRVRRVSRTGSRFALIMLVAALLSGLLLTGLSAAQLVQVERFSNELLVMRARQAAVAFFIRYMRDPLRGPERIQTIVDEAALGATDFMQVMQVDGKVLGSHSGGDGNIPRAPGAGDLRKACDANLEKLARQLPSGSGGRVKVRRDLVLTVLKPAAANPSKVAGRHVLDVLFALPMPDRPLPPLLEHEDGPGKKLKAMFLDRQDLLDPGSPCMIVRVGIDATTQHRTVLTHMGILMLAVLTTLLVLGINVVLYRALKQRERMAESLQRARRVQALGEMAATLAHEIKNPVGAIRGYAQLMRENWLSCGHGSDDPDAEKLSRAVETIVRESTRLEELVTRTLEFARPGDLGLVRCDLREIADAACTMLAGKASERGVSIVTDHAQSPVAAQVDINRIEQVLANLLDNAIEASAPGSAVVVHTSVRGDDSIVEIRDRGRGISPERLENIFAPFFTDRPDGTGLGLAVSRSIVEAHRGTVTAISGGEGHGATFTVAIPR